MPATPGYVPSILRKKIATDAATQPSVAPYFAPMLNDLATMSGSFKGDMEVQDVLNAKNAMEAMRGNLTRAAKLKALGGDPVEAMRPATDGETSKSTLLTALEVLDTPGAAVREKMFEFAGMPTYGDDRLYGEDFIRYLQKKFIGEDKNTVGQRLARGAGGFAIDVATDPLTYLTFGTGAGAKVAGKGLTKAGSKVFKTATAGLKGAEAHKAGTAAVEAALAAAKKGDSPLLKESATRFMGKKVAPDPFAALGKYGKAGYKAMERYSNPALNSDKPLNILQKAAGKGVDLIEHTGKAVSTKFGLSEPYLKMRQVYNNELGLSRTTVKDGVREMFTKPGGKFASRQERELITRAIDEGSVASLSPELRAVAENVSRKFDELGLKLQEAGILKETLDNYMPHILGQELPERLRSGGGRGGSLSTGIGGRGMSRARESIFMKASGQLATPEEQKLIKEAVAAGKRAKAAGRYVRDAKDLTPAERKALKEKIVGSRTSAIASLPEELRPIAEKLAAGETKGDIMYKTFADLFAAQPELRQLAKGDAAKAMANYWAVAERALATKKFMAGVETLADPSVTKWGEKIAKEMKDFTSGGREIEGLPRNIVDDLKRLDEPYRFEPTSWIGRRYKNAHTAFKSMVTVIAPAFHGRNLASNQVLSFLGAGKEMLNPTLYKDVTKALAGAGGDIASRNGIKYSLDEVRQMAREMGVLRPDWGKDYKSVVDIPSLKSKLNPLNWGSKLGGAVENEGRMTSFIANLKSGLSPEDAAKAVDQSLFDYSDLTDFQRKAKWVIPFATFMFKNAELHARTLAKNPGRISAELKLGRDVGSAVIGGDIVEQEDLQALPEYYQEGLKIAREIDEGSAVEVLSGIGLPIEDLGEFPIFDLFNGNAGRFASKVVGRVTPVIKTPIEILSNRDYFFGSPLEGKQVNKDGTVDYPYSRAYPILEKMPQTVQEYLGFEKYQSRGEIKYKLDPMALKKLEAFSLGIASIHPALKGAVFMRYYRDWGKLLDSGKPLDSRILDFTTGVRIHELPGTGTLKEQAAKGRSYQLQNLLNDAIKTREQQLGIPRGM